MHHPAQDMFGAGTDTSSLVLELAMAELMRNPKQMAKLQAQVRRHTPEGQETVEEENLSDMPYLRAVVKETLRLHPPAPLLVPHLSLADCVVDGYHVPSGTRVIVNAWALGRDPGSWEKPEEFLPERFMDGARQRCWRRHQGEPLPLLAVWSWTKDLPWPQLWDGYGGDHASKPRVLLRLAAAHGHGGEGR